MCRNSHPHMTDTFKAHMCAHLTVGTCFGGRVWCVCVRGACGGQWCMIMWHFVPFPYSPVVVREQCGKISDGKVRVHLNFFLSAYATDTDMPTIAPPTDAKNCYTSTHRYTRARAGL